MPNKVWEYPLQEYDRRKEIVTGTYGLIDGPLEFSRSDAKDYTKMLLENGKVYISRNALTEVDNVFNRNNNLACEVKRIWEDGSFYQQKTVYLQTRINRSKFTWEHVVPADVISRRLAKDTDGTFADRYFTGEHPAIERLGHICIVTKYENECLNNYKDSLPEGTTIDGIIDGTQSAWARYIEAGIEVVGVEETKPNRHIDGVLST